MILHITEYCFRCRKLCFTILLVVCIILYTVIMGEETEIKSIHAPWLKIPPDKVLYFTFDNENIINVIDKRFLSFSIDSSQIYKGLRNPSLKDRSLRKRIGHLSGGYLRVGGNAADMLVFSPSIRAWPERQLPIDGGVCSYEHIGCKILNNHQIRRFSMSAEDWHDINNFSNAVGLRLLFDLNVLLRNGNAWNFSNAAYLIDYSNAYQYNIDWQLGNEPNSFRKTFGVEVPPEDLALDFNTLRRLLNRYSIYNTSKLVGPDITNPSTARKGPEVYLTKFLESNPNISAVAWHHYYAGPDTTLDKFLNVSLYDEFRDNCRTVINLAKEKDPLKPVWITETGSAYGGGVKNLSDRFIGSFLWIDKLGVAAREGISVVVRQSLYSGVYSLLDSDTLIPNPDYWVSILYRKLVGRKVLNVSCDSCGFSALRVYGHCSKTSPRVVFYGLNLATVPLGLTLPFNTTTSALLYSLTSPSLTSKVVELNGDRLRLTTFTDALPPLRPVVITLENPLVILPQSIFFLEVDEVLSVCL